MGFLLPFLVPEIREYPLRELLSVHIQILSHDLSEIKLEFPTGGMKIWHTWDNIENHFKLQTNKVYGIHIIGPQLNLTTI